MISVTTIASWTASTLLVSVLLLPSFDGFTLFLLTSSSYRPSAFCNLNVKLDGGNRFRFFRFGKSLSHTGSRLWSSENNNINNINNNNNIDIDIDIDEVKPKENDRDMDTILEGEGKAEGVSHKNKRGQQKAKYVLGDDEDAASFWTPFNSVNKFKPNSTVSSHQSSAAAAATAAATAAAADVAATDSPSSATNRYDLGDAKNSPVEYRVESPLSSKTMIAKDEEGKFLSRALGFIGDNKEDTDHDNTSSKDTHIDTQVIPSTTHHNNAGNDGTITGTNTNINTNTGTSINNTKQDDSKINNNNLTPTATTNINTNTNTNIEPPSPTRYEDIDLSIPPSVYNPHNNTDHVWNLLRHEAQIEAQREPLLVSFLYSTILNHPSLESSLAFHLANRLTSPSMMSTQIMSLITEALSSSPTFRRDLRADIMAVRDRDPACTCLPDVFLHFKGFHALETYRVANFFWATGRRTLAHYLQSQVSQNFQIDIHPNATLRSGIMLDHGTGIVIGETAVVGDNCSILHHVTLGGSGKRGVDRHPKVGNGVLLGAGASILGNIKIGDGCQVGAGTLVIGDLPAHSVAVGVPAKVIGKLRDGETQPGRSMNQVGSKESGYVI